jgi:hypothetical protein
VTTTKLDAAKISQHLLHALLHAFALLQHTAADVLQPCESKQHAVVDEGGIVLLPRRTRQKHTARPFPGTRLSWGTRQLLESVPQLLGPEAKKCTGRHFSGQGKEGKEAGPKGWLLLLQDL